MQSFAPSVDKIDTCKNQYMTLAKSFDYESNITFEIYIYKNIFWLILIEKLQSQSDDNNTSSKQDHSGQGEKNSPPRQTGFRWAILLVLDRPATEYMCWGYVF